MKKILLSLFIALSSVFILVSCEEKTTGEKIEDGIEDVGEDIGDGVDDVKDDVKDATN